MLSAEQLAERDDAHEAALKAWSVEAAERETTYKAYLKRMELEFKQQKEAILATRKDSNDAITAHLAAREAYRANFVATRDARVFLHDKAGEAVQETYRLMHEGDSEAGASSKKGKKGKK